MHRKQRVGKQEVQMQGSYQIRPLEGAEIQAWEVGRDDHSSHHVVAVRSAEKPHAHLRHELVVIDAGVADYQLVDSQGATEGTVKNLTAEAIADITSTGETLRANHLTILPGGLIHRSQAVLFKSKTADWSNGQKAVLGDLLEKLQKS